jgi:lipoprotein NlpI
VDDYLKEARLAFESGRKEEALDLLSKALKADPKNSTALYYRARLFESARQYENAIADYNQLLAMNPASGELFHHRGVAFFKSARIAESIVDFDKAIALVPSQEPHHWQRGISYYYAGRFEEGKKQFELHQTVNPNDVENAVWHFLCAARIDGIEKARDNMIPIQGDTRIPMKEIHALFAGKGSVEQVLAATKDQGTERGGNAEESGRNTRRLYAHLYIALFYEATGQDARVKEHLSKAVAEHTLGHYMGDVARVHLELLSKGR